MSGPIRPGNSNAHMPSPVEPYFVQIVTCLQGCPSGKKLLENLLWTSCRLVGPNSQWGSKNSAYCTSYSYPKCHSNGALFSQDKSIRISCAVLILDKIIAPPGWISNQAWKRMFWWLIQHRKAQNCNIKLNMSWKIEKL